MSFKPEKRTVLREAVLWKIRLERESQILKYGHNDDIMLGFGTTVNSHPWLAPYSGDDSTTVENEFRVDYEAYSEFHGNPTWMHLIREEVAELFDAKTRENMIDEAVQVAALCVSLCEQLMAGRGDDE